MSSFKSQKEIDEAIDLVLKYIDEIKDTTVSIRLESYEMGKRYRISEMKECMLRLSKANKEEKSDKIQQHIKEFEERLYGYKLDLKPLPTELDKYLVNRSHYRLSGKLAQHILNPRWG